MQCGGGLMLFRIRFNKTRGNPGRGTKDHVWRVFDETNKEWLTKNIQINVPCWGAKEENSEDWNIVCVGNMQIDKEKSLIAII
jgi:hypothetical protein